MYLESVYFKRTEPSEKECGFYIGESDNSQKSVILDSDYKPIVDAYDYSTSTKGWLQFRANDNISELNKAKMECFN